MDSLRLLFLGNSFAMDTAEYAVHVAHGLGIPKVKIGMLVIGGCSIAMHYAQAVDDLPGYCYYTSTGGRWSFRENHRISTAVESDNWDWIVVQHGTGDGSRYTSPDCYDKLTPLVEYLKAHAPHHTKIAFNLTWLGESTFPHQEILSYGGDMAAMRQALVETARATVLCNPLIDRLIPTGTAIENARTSAIGLLTRDGYHLSLDKGRYIAALACITALTDLPAEPIRWTPDGVDDYARRVAVEAATNARLHPLDITPSTLTEG